VEILDEIEPKNAENMRLTINFVNVIQLIVYTLLGTFGYLSTMDKSPELVLERELISSRDIISIILFVASYISVLFHLPLNFIVFRKLLIE